MGDFLQAIFVGVTSVSAAVHGVCAFSLWRHAKKHKLCAWPDGSPRPSLRGPLDDSAGAPSDAALQATSVPTRPAPRRTPLRSAPVSLLKPLKGSEDALEDNLESFFTQRTDAPFEIIFSFEDADDPGVMVARNVALRHPHVVARFVHADMSFGLNPKVCSLVAGMRAASYDLILQTDGNVRVPPTYLAEIVDEFLAHDVSLLGTLVAGTDERTTWAAFENLQLNSTIASAMCGALYVIGIPCVVGKAMLLSRSELRSLAQAPAAFPLSVEPSLESSEYPRANPASLPRHTEGSVDDKDTAEGASQQFDPNVLPSCSEACTGLEPVRDVLCEDFMLARHMTAYGRRVRLSAIRTFNVNRDTRARQFFARHARWLKMRAVIHRGSFVADLLANTTWWVTVGWIALLLANAMTPVLAWFGASVIALHVWIDGQCVIWMRGHGAKRRHLLLVPLKDLLMALVWWYAACSRHVNWRGARIRFGAGSRILSIQTKPARKLKTADHAQPGLVEDAEAPQDTSAQPQDASSQAHDASAQPQDTSAQAHDASSQPKDAHPHEGKLTTTNRFHVVARWGAARSSATQHRSSQAGHR